MKMPCLGKQEAAALVRQCLDSGEIVIGPHAQKAMVDDALDIEDLYKVLKAGVIYDEPEQDIRTSDWKYRMEGKINRGDLLAVIFCLRSTKRGFVITVFVVKR